ncbi:hypothetical protein FS837_003015, partial [Tulasnella sp. UAMH 9824]
ELDPEFNDEADWAKFVAISNKVTKVKCNFVLPTSEATNFYQRRKQHDGDTLFQNVLELIVNMSFSDFLTASIVCSPKSPKSIRMYQVLIGGSTDDGWLSQKIPLLSFASCAPSVESIYVDYAYSHQAPSLHRFAQLRVVDCHIFSVAFRWWKDLATCPRLTDLRLQQTAENRTSGWAPDAHVVFPILEKFRYTTATKYMVSLVITRSSFPVLRHFIIHPCPLPDPVETITAHLRDHSPLLQEFSSAEDYVAQQ